MYIIKGFRPKQEPLRGIAGTQAAAFAIAGDFLETGGCRSVGVYPVPKAIKPRAEFLQWPFNIGPASAVKSLKQQAEPVTEEKAVDFDGKYRCTYQLTLRDPYDHSPTNPDDLA